MFYSHFSTTLSIEKQRNIKRKTPTITPAKKCSIVPLPSITFKVKNVKGKAKITFNTETTLISYTVPATKTFTLSGLNIGGNAVGIFNIYVDLSLIMVVRTSASEQTKFLTMTNFTLTAGQILDVKCLNSGHKQQSQDYNATIIGGIS